MKKTHDIGLLFCFFLSIGTTLFAQKYQDSASRLFDSTEAIISEAKYCRVDIYKKSYYDWADIPAVTGEESVITINNKAAKKATVVLDPNGYRSIFRDNKKMIRIDFDRKSFAQIPYSRNWNSEFVSWEDDLRMREINMVPCFAPWMKSFRGKLINTPQLLSVGDTIVAGRVYRVIHGKQTFPRNYNLTYLVNANTHLIEYLTKDLADSLEAQNGWPTRDEISYSVSFDDHTTEMVNLFSPTNPNYADYEFTDNNEISMCHNLMKVGDTLSASLLDFPMQRLDGSWTTLREQKGYILLDFFYNQCAPCIKFMKEQAAERDSLGMTRLEANDIQVVSINTDSRNIELTKNVVNGYLEDRDVVVAFGILKYIKVPAYPTFMLISPQKKILCITDRSVNQYIEKIIKAKCQDK